MPATILKHERKKRRLSLSRLAALARVSVKSVEHIETAQFNRVGLIEVIALAKALGNKLTVVPIATNKATLPTTLPGILATYDQLLKTGRCVSFFSKQPDKEHADVFWDVVGDPERNWLFVVASNPKKDVRIANVTDDPGGWAIAGQRFGIDAETQNVADALAEQLLKTHFGRVALTAANPRTFSSCQRTKSSLNWR